MSGGHPPAGGDLEHDLDAIGDIEAATALVCEHVAAFVPLMPSIYLEQHGLLRCQAQRGYWQILDGVPITTGPMARCFRTGEAVESYDVRSEGELLDADPDLSVQVAEPLRAGGQVVGVLSVESPSPLDERQRAATAAAAERLSAWLDRRWSPRPPLALERLARVGRQLAEVHNERDAEALVVRLAIEVSELRSAVLLRPTADGPLEQRAAQGSLGTAFALLSAADVQRLHRAASRVSSLYTSDEATGRTQTATEALRQAGAASFAVAPVRSRSGPVALLAVLDERRIPIRTHDIEALELLALLAATALDTASLVSDLRLRASHDPLTGLANHRSFHEAVVAADRGHRSWSVVMIDLDRFKAINDRHGHLEGDRVLRDVAAALPGALQPGERAFRVGGDEFAVLLPVNDLGRARAVAALAVDVARPVLEPYGAALSAGVAAPNGDEPIDEVLARADRLLYDAKWEAAGRPMRRAVDRQAQGGTSSSAGSRAR